MPRLSLYKPEKSADYRFIDKNVNEAFQVGGTDVFVHKYLGPEEPGVDEATPTTPYTRSAEEEAMPETKIQDLLFLENRDRRYSDDVYILRGIYNVQDLDFDLSQFGMFLQNDTIFVTFHINSSVDSLGRKPMPGDVLEFPHLKDDYALNDFQVSLKRFYVIEDVNRSAEGFSQTWYPHLYRCKCKPVMDSQEFKDIFNKDAGAGDGSTLRDVMSTFEKEMQINQAILDQAAEDVPSSGYDTSKYFIVPTDADGNVDVNDDGSSTPTLKTAKGNYYVGYLTEDGIPPNGASYDFGTNFPSAASEGDFYLRTDYFPNRLFRYNGSRWVKFEDNVRATLPGSETATTQVGTFVNNTNKSTIAGKEVEERQSLSQALKPKADN